MEVLVTNRDSVNHLSGHRPDSHVVISIATWGEDCVTFEPSPTRKGILFMHFDDLACNDEEMLRELRTRYPAKYRALVPRLFTRRQARTILDFVRKHRSHVTTIICQCEAGVSRSAAVAAALSEHLGADYVDYFRHPDYSPNAYVYKLLSKSVL